MRSRHKRASLGIGEIDTHGVQMLRVPELAERLTIVIRTEGAPTAVGPAITMTVFLTIDTDDN